MGKKNSDNGGQEFIAFVREFSNESDRAAVIVGAAKLDNLLYQLLQQFLLPVPSGNDELLDSEAALGTFSARINAAFRLGLIDSEYARALHLIRKIRNSFAHETSSNSLAVGSHRDRIRELVAPLTKFAQYDNLIENGHFGNSEGSSREFRVALAIACGGLILALRDLSQIVPQSTIHLISANWSRKT